MTNQCPKLERRNMHRLSARPTNRPRLTWHLLTACICLAALTWVVFGQTLWHDFVNYDDPRYVYQNTRITSGLNIAGVAWAFSHIHAENWHPLTTITHMLDCQLYGLNAGGHHFTNVLFHTVAVVLLFVVSGRGKPQYLTASKLPTMPSCTGTSRVFGVVLWRVTAKSPARLPDARIVDVETVIP